MISIRPNSSLMANATPSRMEYTREEMLVLASLRRDTKRTCSYCAWYVKKGTQKGCFPNGDYRKWLSPEEFGSGCEEFEPREKKS